MKLKLIFATILLCILISLTAVSAVDINQTEDFVAEDSDTVTQEILTDENDDSGDFKTLQNEIKTNVNNTFNLERNYIFDEVNDTEYSNGIVIDKDNFTIDGHGYTIDASNNARIFNITGSGITLKNINFINGYAASGAAICFKEGDLTIIGCNFTNNNAYGDNLEGGAIEFTGNDLTIDNSVFAKNTAALNSGAIYFKGNSLLITNSEFKSNKAEEFAGAIEVDEESNSTIIINTKFNNNTAKNYAALGIYDGNVLIDNCTFDSNHANEEVGALYLNCPMSVIIDSYFINNTAKEDTIVAHSNGNLTVDSCQFIDNFAVLGNIIHNALNSNLTVLNSIFDGDFFKGKTIKNIYGNLYLHNNTITDSYAEIYSYGGIITSPVTAVILSNETKYKHLNENISIYFDIYDDNGNMMQVDGFDLFVNNTKIDYAFNERKWQYEAYFTADKLGLYTVSVVGDSLTNLTSKNGEIVVMNVTDDFSTLQKLVDECNGTLTLTKNYTFNPLTDVNREMGVEIMDNITIDGAGFTLNGNNLSSIFFVFSGNVTIKNITFINGNYEYEGGAVYWAGDDGQLADCKFINNHAEDGGAVYWSGDNGKISNCIFTENNATCGGALFFENDAGNVTNSNFVGNKAIRGSAIYFGDFSSSNVISDSSFLNNRANVDDATPFNVTVNESRIEIVFVGQDNLINAINSPVDIDFSNVTYWGAEGITNTDTFTPSRLYREAGQNISIVGVVNGNIINATKVTDENGTIVLDDVVGNYWIVVRHDDDSYYTEAEKIISQNMTFNVNVTSQSTNNKTVNITAKSNIFNEFMPGKLLFVLPNGSQIDATYASNGTWWAEFTFNEYDEFNVSASYIGLDNVTINNGTINITRADCTITLDDIVINYGESINVTVTTDGATAITAKIDGNDVEVVNNFTIPISGLDVGNYTLTVTTIADGDHNPVNKTVSIIVKDYIVVSAPDVTKYYNGTERFVVTVTDSKNNPLANQSVIISVNGVNYTRTTDANGTASIAINLISGQHNVTTIVNNNTVYSTVTVLPTVNGTDVVKVFRNATQYYATFRDSEGNYLANGTEVQFNINGVMYDRKVSGNEGLAKLNINLEQGEYIITAINPETGEMSSNNITVIPRIIENNNLTKYYKNDSQYTVKIIGDDGNPVGAGVNVTFNINGVFYTRTTNESGIAKLNINLQPGDYVITAEYMNCSVSNSIKVLPVLSADDLTKKYGTPDQFIATLLNGQGNPYANQTVKFNINGVFYDRTTDSSGQAKLNINLQAGEYIITSSYNGCNISNKITVTA